MQSCDVLVIGAGIAGASAAYELAPYARVVLLERERQPGYHATGRSAAVFAPAYGNRVIRALTQASHRFYRKQMEGLAEHAVLAPRGALFIGRADQIPALDRLLAETAPQVPGLERLDRAALLARLPALRPDYVAAGIYDPSAMDLDVAAIHQAYLKGLRARGGQLITDAEVVRIATDFAPWRVETRAGPFEAAVLVDAAGAWADQLAGLAGVAPIGLVARRRTAFLFEPSAPVDRAWPAVIDAEEQFYFKPESGLLLGSPADATPMPPCGRPARGARHRTRGRPDRARDPLSGPARAQALGGAADLRPRSDPGGRHGGGGAGLLLARRAGRLRHPDRARARARRREPAGRRRPAGRSAPSGHRGRAPAAAPLPAAAAAGRGPALAVSGNVLWV